MFKVNFSLSDEVDIAVEDITLQPARKTIGRNVGMCSVVAINDVSALSCSYFQYDHVFFVSDNVELKQRL